jgi:hypothetical protein
MEVARKLSRLATTHSVPPACSTKWLVAPLFSAQAAIVPLFDLSVHLYVRRL